MMKPIDPKAAEVKRSPSELTTLVCAVSLAVALGVACGAWINARLASAASESSVAVNRLRPAERAAVRDASEPPAAVEPAHVEHDDAPTAPAEEPPADDSPEAEASPREKASATRRAAEVEKRQGGAREVLKSTTAGRGRVSPCALYASANSLSVRGGGAATLILGGPGDAGRVTVTTPNWSDIAIFSEGRVGDKGWVRYSVRSISKRAGVYAVRFTTPCGSQTIPVTVTRP